ncbi:hypothetical protein FE374_10470 [Georgenia yuyongxinii]|uniref:VOC domain-containing protein n=1 Tax=Georgenia yuyongxinii TaxID=2589797 RepID=A0A5B8C870_9MICO|nr:hypothetical protein FE374_10470 [Georgenia yuyongxinii]
MFSRFHHICIVVSDIDRSVAAYESIGIGPWNDMSALPPITEFTIDGEAAELAGGFRYREAHVDGVAIRLCEPPEGDSPQRRFLDTKGQGVFHVGFAVDDIVAADTEVTQALGLSAYIRGRRSDGSGWTHFDTSEKFGVLLELRQSPAAKSADLQDA